MIKGIYEKYTANIILNLETFNALPLRSETKYKCPRSPNEFALYGRMSQCHKPIKKKVSMLERNN